jgi:hypothetical protein
LTEIKEMELPELNGLIKARMKAIEKRNKAEESARKFEKELKKMR